MAGYTPGPWKVHRRLVERLPNGVEFYETTIHTAWEHAQLKGPAPVVCGYVHIKQDGTVDHGVHIEPDNAALIAAAPDLVEACRVALDWLRKAHYTCEDGITAGHCGRVIKKLEKALEMAERRTSPC